MQLSFRQIFILAVSFAALGGVSSDLYLPSLPAIAHSLNTSISMTQLTVAIFLFGMGCARLMVAIVSDATGRKPALLVSLLLCLLGCCCCLVASNIYLLLLGRLLQGFGAGGANVIGRVILRDKVPGEFLAKYLSYFSMSAISLIAIAPFAGGYIEHYLGWRATFIILLIYTALMLLLAFLLLPETNIFKDPGQLKLKKLKFNFITLFTNKSFTISALILPLGFGCFMAWITSGPIILQKIAHLSPITFGYCAALVGFCYFLSTYLNSKYVNKFGIEKMRIFGSWIMLIAGITMILSTYIVGVNPIFIVGAAMLTLFGCGFVMPNSFATGLLPFAEIAGIAVAVLSTLQVLGGSLASTIIALVPEYNQIPLAIVIVIAGFSCMIILKIQKNQKGFQ